MINLLSVVELVQLAEPLSAVVPLVHTMGYCIPESTARRIATLVEFNICLHGTHYEECVC